MVLRPSHPSSARPIPDALNVRLRSISCANIKDCDHATIIGRVEPNKSLLASASVLQRLGRLLHRHAVFEHKRKTDQVKPD